MRTRFGLWTGLGLMEPVTLAVTLELPPSESQNSESLDSSERTLAQASVRECHMTKVAIGLVGNSRKLVRSRLLSVAFVARFS